MKSWPEVLMDFGSTFLYLPYIGEYLLTTISNNLARFA